MLTDITIEPLPSLFSFDPLQHSIAAQSHVFPILPAMAVRAFGDFYERKSGEQLFFFPKSLTFSTSSCFFFLNSTLLSQVACIATILPLALYIGCQEEFAAKISPCSPSGYLFIARRTFAAFGNSESGKVTGKDL